MLVKRRMDGDLLRFLPMLCDTTSATWIGNRRFPSVGLFARRLCPIRSNLRGTPPHLPFFLGLFWITAMARFSTHCRSARPARRQAPLIIVGKTLNTISRQHRARTILANLRCAKGVVGQMKTGRIAAEYS